MLKRAIKPVTFLPKGNYPGAVAYRYDNSGNILEKTVYDADGTVVSKEIYSHPAPGRVVEREIYDADGKFRSKEVDSYDAKGKLTETASYLPRRGESSKLSGTLIYTYDAKGNRIEKNIANSSGTIMDGHKEVYKYDDKGNMVEKITVFSRLSYAYDKFDSRGNWIKRTTSKWVNKFNQSFFEPFEVIYRTITYY